jgi:hypothetical protein
LTFSPGRAAATGLAIAVFLACLSGAVRAEEEFRGLAEVLFEGDPHPDTDRVKRWTGRVGWLTTEKDPSILSEIQRAVAEMNGILAGTGVSLYRTESEPGLIITFLPADKLASIPGSRARSGADNVGLSIVFSNRESEISFASIAISKGLTPAHLRYVLRHELMHAVGLPKHATSVSETILRQIHERDGVSQRFTAFDLRAIRFLYGQLPPGATPEDARARWQEQTFPE